MSATFIIGFVVLVVAMAVTFIYGWRGLDREAVENSISPSSARPAAAMKAIKEDLREKVQVKFAGRWCEGRMVRPSTNGLDLVELTDRRCATGQVIGRYRNEILRSQVA